MTKAQKWYYDQAKKTLLYDNRAAFEYSKKLGRPLTNEEYEKFRKIQVRKIYKLDVKNGQLKLI